MHRCCKYLICMKVEEIHLYINFDHTTTPLTLRMLMCYPDKPNNDKPPETKYFAAYNDVDRNIKVVLLTEKEGLDVDDKFCIGKSSANMCNLGVNVGNDRVCWYFWCK